MNFPFVRLIFLLALATTLFSAPEPSENLTWRHYVAPVFPLTIQQTAVRDGFATLAFTFDDAGKITDHLVLAASHPAFAQAATVAVRQWQIDTTALPATVRREIRRFDFLRDGQIVGLTQRDAMKSAFNAFGDFVDAAVLVHREEELAAPLKLTAGAPPVFPAELVGKAVEGEVVLDFVVDTEGRVRVPAATAASHAAFAVAALESVRAWRFRPADLNRQPVSVLTTRTLRFTPR